MSKFVRHPIPVDGSIDGERHVRRSPGGRGRHAAKEADNGRSRRKKERKERARGTSETRRHPWQRYVSKRRSRAHSSMRDVDGLVKPRLRGTGEPRKPNETTMISSRNDRVHRCPASRSRGEITGRCFLRFHYRSSATRIGSIEKFTFSDR